MNVNEKLLGIIENQSYLTKQDEDTINRIYKRVERNKKAEQNTDELLQYTLSEYNALFEKSLLLTDLRKSFADYMRDKGLQTSMLSITEIISMIGNDLQQLSNVRSEFSYLIDAFKAHSEYTANQLAALNAVADSEGAGLE